MEPTAEKENITQIEEQIRRETLKHDQLSREYTALVEVFRQKEASTAPARHRFEEKIFSVVRKINTLRNEIQMCNHRIKARHREQKERLSQLIETQQSLLKEEKLLKVQLDELLHSTSSQLQSTRNQTKGSQALFYKMQQATIVSVLIIFLILLYFL